MNIKKHQAIIAEILRYSVVGGIAFLVDTGTLFVLTSFAHVYYLVSAVFGFCLGLFVNYVLSIKWVFHERKLANNRHEFLIFCVIGIVGLAFNELFLYIFTDLLSFYFLTSKIVSTVLVYAWNYGARRFTLFTKK